MQRCVAEMQFDDKHRPFRSNDKNLVELTRYLASSVIQSPVVHATRSSTYRQNTGRSSLEHVYSLGQTVPLIPPPGVRQEDIVVSTSVRVGVSRLSLRIVIAIFTSRLDSFSHHPSSTRTGLNHRTVSRTLREDAALPTTLARSLRDNSPTHARARKRTQPCPPSTTSNHKRHQRPAHLKTPRPNPSQALPRAEPRLLQWLELRTSR
jgi:hypothetical protein